MSKERPILFNGEMVRAILDGRKTQTRRIIKRQPAPGNELKIRFDEACEFGSNIAMKSQFQKCPFGKPGDRLYVRENAWISPENFTDFGSATHPHGRVVGYSASMSAEAVRCAKDYGVKQTPSIHMPRWASRLLLEITGVRVERIQGISIEDCAKEGIASASPFDQYGKIDFAKLWESAYPSSWLRNDWVWVIEFKKGDT